jgi:diguanylate cyclase (GGDEF)-like protein
MHRLADGRYCPVGVVLCDVDGLKLINDAMGHDEGDALLVAAADILRASFRVSDIVARIGGDEFVVLLPNTGEYSVAERCDRIRREVEQYNRGGGRFPLALSLGYAVAERPPVDMDELFKRADNAMYEQKLQERSRSRNMIVEAITRIMDERDYIKLGHAERLARYARMLGRELDLSEKRLDDLRLLARYHDLGKVGIPERILHKPGPLTEEEYEEVKRHPELGHRIALSIDELAPIADYILKHHERWDGRGYPIGLAGQTIPLESRIIALADAFDAMTSARHRRTILSRREAAEELRRCAGGQFDPDLAERFLRLIDEGRV